MREQTSYKKRLKEVQRREKREEKRRRLGERQKQAKEVRAVDGASRTDADREAV